MQENTQESVNMQGETPENVSELTHESTTVAGIVQIPSDWSKENDMVVSTEVVEIPPSAPAPTPDSFSASPAGVEHSIITHNGNPVGEPVRHVDAPAIVRWLTEHARELVERMK